LPEKLTLWTGLDAFIHALEAYLSKQSNDYVNEIAYLALKYIINNLPRAVKDGSNLEAREKMMLGSYLAGWAMENVGLGLIHGMSHQVGAFYHHHHGLLNALLLPSVVEYNYSACVEKINTISKLFPNDNEQDFVTVTRNYYDMLGLETEITIRETDIPTMARMAVRNVNSKTNPRTPVQEEVENLYHCAFNVKKDI
ncbi:MAG: iron-containing alcohol dehydrogenase family protein, partial [Halanaerobiales bacterium]